MYSGIFDVPAADAPSLSIRSLADMRRQYRYLRALGSELHVTGGGADSLFDLSPRKYLGQQAGLSTLPQLMRAVLQTARSEHDSPRHVLADIWHNAKSNPAAELRALSHMLPSLDANSEQLDLRIFGSATAPQWLTPAIRQEVAAYAASVADHAAIPEGMDPATYKTYTALLSFGLSHYNMSQLAATTGLRQQSAYTDNDILKLCFGLPAHIRMNPWEVQTTSPPGNARPGPRACS